MLIVEKFCILIYALGGVSAQIKIQPAAQKSPSSTYLTINGAISRQSGIGPRSLSLSSRGSSVSLAELTSTSHNIVNNAAAAQNSPNSIRRLYNIPGRNSPTSLRVQPNVAPAPPPPPYNAVQSGRVSPPPLHLRQVHI